MTQITLISTFIKARNKKQEVRSKIYFLPLASYLLLFISCLFVLLLSEVSAGENTREEDTPQDPNYVFAVCDDVVDGNTIEVNILGMKKKLRLIGVNVGSKGIFEGIKTRLGIGPVVYLRKTVKGKKLYLEFENDWTDPSGALRGYVRLKEDGTFINFEMVKLGYATADRRSKYKYKKEFEKVER